MSAEGLGRRHYLLLLGIFLATRLLIYALGLRFQLDLSWMFLSDLTALRERLLETVYYFHAFAPGMNLLTGLMLKLAPEHVSFSAAALFWASGYLLLASACRLFRLLGCSRWAATAAALGLSLVPQSIYLENLYLYTHLCTSLVCWAAVTLHGALERGSARSWLGFFSICALLGWLYTVFHLAWFLLLGLGAVLLAGRGRRRAVLRGGLAPLLLLFGLYAKNYWVFGVFGATSWGGANITLATTQRMPLEERRLWIAEGRLSPFAALSVFANPGDYLKFLPPDLHFPWPTTNELWRPSVDAPNFNHGLFLQVNHQRKRDAAAFIRREPGEYLRTVFGRNLPALFSPTTHWHKLDNSPASPHHQHRSVLGAYERWYDRLVHGWPVRRVGLYVFFPLFYLWALGRCYLALKLADPSQRPRAALLGFCLLQIAFITATSSLFVSGESGRYRYSIEPFLWGVSCLGCQAALARLSSHWLRLRTRWAQARG